MNNLPNHNSSDSESNSQEWRRSGVIPWNWFRRWFQRGEEKQSPKPPRKLDAIQLEDRILYSASPFLALFDTGTPELGAGSEAIDPSIQEALEHLIASLYAAPDTPSTAPISNLAIDGNESATATITSDDTQSNAAASEASDDGTIERQTARLSNLDAEVLGSPSISSDLSEVPSSPSSASLGPRNELIILQDGLYDIDRIIEDFASQESDDRHFDILILDRLESGFDQIDAWIAQYHNLDAIHIVSHGSDGMIQLGSSWLTSDNVAEHLSDLHRWGMALSETGDILIYGCDVANSSSGEAFLSDLAAITNADVAASSDVTGHANLGGDWVLEFSIGQIENKLLFLTDVMANWHGTLDLTALSGEVLVNGSTGSNQWTSPETGGAIAMDATGRYVVTWYDNRSGNDDVYARVYNADGTARTAEFMVHAADSSAQDWTSVAMADNGNFVVTWSDNRSGSYEVHMRLFNVDGTALTSETVVSSRTGIQDFHAVDMASDGSFVVVFLDQQVNDIYFQRYNSSGVAQGSNTIANSTTSQTQNRPDIAVNDNGSFIVTWTSDEQDSANSLGVYARIFNSSGTATSSEILVNQTTSGDQTFSSIDSDSSGNFVVSWESGTDIYMRRFNSSGTALSNEALMNTYTSGTQTYSHVDMNASGDFVVVWQDNNGKDGSGVGAYAQQFDSAGTRIGGEVLVATTSTNSQEVASVAYSGSSVAFAWQGNGTGDTQGIFTRRFSAQNFSTITVNTSSNTSDGTVTSIAALLENRGADGVISLREAIQAVNNSTNGTGGADRIYFNIGSGNQTITVSSTDLPNITQAVVIDATTQSGFSGDPLISLVDGDSRATGLKLLTGSDGSTIRGLNIQGFGTAGISIDSSNNTIAGNWIGTNSTGTAAAANYDGITIWSGDNNVIGGTSSADRNVISGNTDNGLSGSSSADNTQIIGNYFGTDKTGQNLVANLNHGIWYANSIGLQVGGDSTAKRNIFVSDGWGVEFDNVDNSYIQGNHIGLAADGSTILGNDWGGILLFNGSSGNYIGTNADGTNDAGERNVISGNATGVFISGTGTSGNYIYGNYVGTDATGLLDRGNTSSGIVVNNSATNNYVGGTNSTTRNIISGNDGNAVTIDGEASDGNFIYNNWIGLAANGTTVLRNSGMASQLPAGRTTRRLAE